LLDLQGYSQKRDSIHHFVKKTDLEKAHLKGKVKQFSLFYFKIDTMKNELIVDTTYYRYNLDGNLIDLKSSSGSRTTFQYNSDGMLVKEIAYSNVGQIDFIDTFKYDSLGFEIEEDCFFKMYNDKFYYTFKYDENGNQIESLQHYPGSLGHKKVSKYDERGIPLEFSEFDDRNELYQNVIFEYDKSGEYIGEISKSDIERILNYKTTIKRRRIDKKGNALKEIIYENGKPNAIYKSVIEYY
jgi:YD repeat-containing protein